MPVRLPDFHPLAIPTIVHVALTYFRNGVVHFTVGNGPKEPMYSACAHISGMAEPVGYQEHVDSGSSASSQDLLGSNPVVEANSSIARMYISVLRPAASS